MPEQETPAASSSTEAAVAPSWWVRLCRWLWRGLLFVCGTLVLGVLVNVGSSWLITKNFDLAGTPLGWGMDHLWVMLFLLFLLAMLTMLSWVGSQQRPTSTPLSP